MRALLYLRRVQWQRRAQRLWRDLLVYLSDGAWITYLFVGGFFGLLVLDALLHPERLAPRQIALLQLTGGFLLAVAAPAALLLSALGGIDFPPLQLSPGDSRFLLTAPLPPTAVLLERLVSLQLDRAGLGLLAGGLGWPLLRFLWPGFPLASALLLGLELGLLAGTSAGIAVLLALAAQRWRRLVAGTRLAGSALLLLTLLAVGTLPAAQGSAAWAVLTERLATAGPYPPLFGYSPWPLLGPLLALWLVAGALVATVLLGLGPSEFATHSALWLRLRSLLRAGRKAEARRLLRRAGNAAAPAARWVQRYDLPLYGAGLRAVLFRQLTALFRAGPTAWLSGLGIPALALVLLLLRGAGPLMQWGPSPHTLSLGPAGQSPASSLLSLPGLVAAGLLFLTLARWYRQGSGGELAHLNSLILLPISLPAFLAGQVGVTAAGLLPLTLLAAWRLWQALVGGPLLALLLLTAAVLAALELALTALLEDWLAAQAPFARDRLLVSGALVLLPALFATGFPGAAGVGAYIAAAALVTGGGLIWLRTEIGKAALGR